MAESSQSPASQSPNLPKDPRFQYQDIAPPALSVDKLDAIAESVLDPTPEKQLGIWGLIVNGIRLVLAVAWLSARKILIDQQRELAKQQYEQGQDAQAQTQVNQATAGLDVSRPKPQGG